MSLQSFFRNITRDMNASPLLRMTFRIADNFFHDSCLIRASGLAFNSLLALVPLSAILFAFGGLNSVSGELQDFLVDVLLPSSLNQILDALNVFTENSTRLGTYGIAFFLITVLLLMNNIENNLNAIWHCRRKRNFFQQFTIYTTVIVFGSLLIGGNFSISGSFLAIIPDYTEALKEPLLQTIFQRIGSATFIALTFLLLIILIPSTRVSFLSALTGALTGAVIWELAKWGFKTWAAYSVRNSVIYGALFLIPLLLIWLYVVWLIIIIAMETAYVHQHRHEPHIRYGKEKRSFEQFALLDGLYMEICRAYLNGHHDATVRYLADQLSRNEEDVSQGISALTRENLITRTEDGRFLPRTAPESMLLSRLYETIGGMGEQTSRTVNSFLKGGRDTLNNMTVSDLIGENDRIDD